MADTLNLVNPNDSLSWAGEQASDLKVIYEDGVFYNQTTLEKIRERLKK